MPGASVELTKLASNPTPNFWPPRNIYARNSASRNGSPLCFTSFYSRSYHSSSESPRRNHTEGQQSGKYCVTPVSSVVKFPPVNGPRSAQQASPENDRDVTGKKCE